MLLLAVGDIVGESGLGMLERTLSGFKKLKGVDFTIVNGENAAGMGLTPKDADRIFTAGADVITLGNHSFSRREILNFMEDNPYILRPANYANINPGVGYGVYDAPRGRRIAVINLIGRLFNDGNYDSPFVTADKILKDIDADFIAVDMHAEATSEKLALARYLDGRVSCVFGTHTHVQTADEQVFPKGTGSITDLGMTGVKESVLGVTIDSSIDRFLGKVGGRYTPAAGKECFLNGALFQLDDKTFRCTGVERVRIEN